MQINPDDLLEQVRTLEARNRDLQARLNELEAAIPTPQAGSTNPPNDLNRLISPGFTGSPRIRRIEEELHSINRKLKLGYYNDRALIFAADEVSYLQQFCQIIVEECRYSLVWIGFTVDDAEKSVQPVAFAGFDEEYVKSLSITWEDTEHGRGPSGTAIRTGKPVACHNITTDPKFKPWREGALLRGYDSSLAVPLIAEGTTFGVITIYSCAGDPFTPEEVELISRLADDVSLGIQTIRLREAHFQTEVAFSKSEARFRSLFDQMTEGFALHEIVCDDHGIPYDYKFLEINAAFEHLTGITREQVIGKSMREVMTDNDPSWIRIYGEVALTGQPIQYEYYANTVKSYFEVYAFSPSPNQFAVLFRDVTQRKLVEEELKWSEKKYRTLFETMTQGIIFQNRYGQIISANPAAERILGMSIAQMQGRTSRDPIWGAIHEDGTNFPGEDHPIPQALKSGQTIRDVVVGVYNHETNDYRWVKVDAIPQFHPGESQPYQVYAIFDDITQRKRMEQTVEKTNLGLIRLNKLARELSAIFNIDLILQKSLDAVKELLQGMESCRIWLWDEQTPGWLVCRAAIGASCDLPAINLEAIMENLPDWLANPEAFSLIFREPSVIQDGPNPGDETNDLHNVNLIPLRSGEKINGIVELRAKPGQGISPYEMTVLETLASCTAIALENAQIYNQSRQVAVEAERNRLARDLHDSVSQALFSASMIAEALPRLWEQKPELVIDGLNQLVQLTHGALAEMRSLLFELRPSTLLEIDLCDLLKMLVSATLGRSDLSIDLDLSNICSPSQEIKIVIYRIAQEAMNNIVKHSGAKHVTISLCMVDQGVELHITDDGRGFDKSHITQGHMGLEFMRERAEKSGIQLSIESGLNQGTEIIAFWPGNSSSGTGVH
jgi:PAS domain S-box-containing protein